MTDTIEESEYLEYYAKFLANKVRYINNNQSKCKKCSESPMEIDEDEHKQVYFQIKCGEGCDNYKITYPEYTNYEETLRLPTDDPTRERALKSWNKINDIPSKTKELEQYIQIFKNFRATNVSEIKERIDLEKKILKLLKYRKKNNFIRMIGHKATYTDLSN
jgi:hypothetical protein